MNRENAVWGSRGVAGHLRLAATFDEYGGNDRQAFEARRNLADQPFRCPEKTSSGVLKITLLPLRMESHSDNNPGAVFVE